jgi:hypothetical protein
MAVGLYITAAYWFTASTSFANPAVTVARGFSDTFAGIRPVDMPLVHRHAVHRRGDRFRRVPLAAGRRRGSDRGGLKPRRRSGWNPPGYGIQGRSHAMGGYILAIDQGTTSSRAIVFDGEQNIAGVGQKEFRSISRNPAGSSTIWRISGRAWSRPAATAIERAGIAASDIAAIGITNQRETVAMWDRATGEPVHRAIVWQDRRTADFCDELKAKGNEAAFTENRPAARSVFLRHQDRLAAR